MGCVCGTAKRRRKQAAQGFTHLHAKQRPRYKKSDATTSKRRLQRLIETERRMAAKSR